MVVVETHLLSFNNQSPTRLTDGWVVGVPRAIMFAVIEIYLERTFTLGRVESVSVLCQQSWGLQSKNVLQLVCRLLT